MCVLIWESWLFFSPPPFYSDRRQEAPIAVPMMGQVKEASIQQLLAGETVLSGSNDFSCEDKMFSGIRNLLHSSHAHLLEGQILISLALVNTVGQLP